MSSGDSARLQCSGGAMAAACVDTIRRRAEGGREKEGEEANLPVFLLFRRGCRRSCPFPTSPYQRAWRRTSVSNVFTILATTKCIGGRSKLGMDMTTKHLLHGEGIRGKKKELKTRKKKGVSCWQERRHLLCARSVIGASWACNLRPRL